MNNSILLLGDSCKDIYHYGRYNSFSEEAPIPIFKESHIEIREGMSSNVKNNLLSFGFNINHFHNKNIIEKHRLFDTKFNSHIFRYDVGESNKVDEINLSDISFLKNKISAVVISDYDKGFLREKSISEICNMFSHVPIFVDTKKTNLSCFNNCILKINELEFSKCRNLNASNKLIITLGEKGSFFNGKIYPTIKKEIFDVCGAGDVFLSSFVYKFLQNSNFEQSISFANKCASFSVSKIGTYVLSRKDIETLET
jgi:D-beta-D-heptose 7-phosphate kinase/D-beta-D-heptose 1-phosphate adenosyltransferase